MQEISTDVLNQNVRKGLTLNWSTQAILFCAIIIACIGLNTNSAPIVIGAMLISPLMGPIVGIGYALGNSNSGLLSGEPGYLLRSSSLPLPGQRFTSSFHR